MQSQVKIGQDTNPEKGAILDLNGTAYKGGLLLPNVDITDLGKIPNTFTDESVRGLDDAPDLAGLLVWNTHSGSEGVYMWDGSDWQLLTVNSCDAPATPGTITLSKTSLKQGEKFTASVPAVEGVDGYAWSLPDGLTGSSDTWIITITANTPGYYDIGTISVKSLSICGKSAASTSEQSIDVEVWSPWTLPCLSVAKQMCTCPKGTRVAAQDATPEQWSFASSALFTGIKWYMTDVNNENDVWYYQSGEWSATKGDGCYLCW
jgi:hypothetical protein